MPALSAYPRADFWLRRRNELADDEVCLVQQLSYCPVPHPHPTSSFYTGCLGSSGDTVAQKFSPRLGKAVSSAVSSSLQAGDWSCFSSESHSGCRGLLLFQKKTLLEKSPGGIEFRGKDSFPLSLLRKDFRVRLCSHLCLYLWRAHRNQKHSRAQPRLQVTRKFLPRLFFFFFLQGVPCLLFPKQSIFSWHSLPFCSRTGLQLTATWFILILTSSSGTSEGRMEIQREAWVHSTQCPLTEEHCLGIMGSTMQVFHIYRGWVT